MSRCVSDTMCEAAGYLLHLGGGGAEELYVPRPDDLLVLQQRLHGEEVSRYCHLIFVKIYIEIDNHLLPLRLLPEEDERVARGAAVRLLDEEHAALLVQHRAAARLVARAEEVDDLLRRAVVRQPPHADDHLAAAAQKLLSLRVVTCRMRSFK